MEILTEHSGPGFMCSSLSEDFSDGGSDFFFNACLHPAPHETSRGQRFFSSGSGVGCVSER